MLVQILGQVLGHSLGQGRNQHALVDRNPLVNFREDVIYLCPDRPDLDLRVNQPRRPHQLLDDLRRMPGLVLARSGRYENHLRREPFHSSNFNGRLSNAEGSRKPYSTSTSLRDRSPLYMAPSCGIVWWLSSITSSAFDGR